MARWIKTSKNGRKKRWKYRLNWLKKLETELKLDKLLRIADKVSSEVPSEVSRDLSGTIVR
jgi:hypothetical protein